MPGLTADARTIAAGIVAWVGSLVVFTVAWGVAFGVCVLLPVWLLTR